MKTKILIGALIVFLLGGIIYLAAFRNSAPVVTPPPSGTVTTFPIATTLQSPDRKKTFNLLLTTPPRPAFKTVLDTMQLDVYGVLPCTELGGGSIIMLTAKYSENKPINTFDAAVNAVTAWESYIPADIGPLLFPASKVVAPVGTEGFVKLVATNPNVVTMYEKKQVVTVDGKPGTIYYAWTLNYLFFATTQSCLEGAMSVVYPGD